MDIADRQHALTELLRREAQRCGLLDASDEPEADGTISRAAAEAIERLVERQWNADEPDEAACRRFHAAHPALYSVGERVRARHILFAVTAGVDLNALRQVAEQTLLDLRTQPDAFAERAAHQSNCPSSERGGDLGWLGRDDCVPELARELFAHAEVGVLPRLVHSRYGLHVVEVLAREAGELQPFEQVRAAVALSLQRQAQANALRAYLHRLAAEAGLDAQAFD